MTGAFCVSSSYFTTAPWFPALHFMEKLFSTQYVNISLHRTTHNTIELHWLDFVPSADFRATMLELLRLARLHGVQAWVADNRLIRALRPVDLEWAGSDVIVPMGESGVRRLAIVESQDAINRMGVNSMLPPPFPTPSLPTTSFSPSRKPAPGPPGPSSPMRTLPALPYLTPHLPEAPPPVLELQWLSYVGSAGFRKAGLQARHFPQQHLSPAPGPRLLAKRSPRLGSHWWG